jgi:hypothetical protein
MILCLLPGARRHNLPEKALTFIKSFIVKKPTAATVTKNDDKKSM